MGNNIKSTFKNVDAILTLIFIPIIISSLLYFLILNSKTVSYFMSYHNNHQLEPIFNISIDKKIDDFYEDQSYMTLPGTYDGCFCYNNTNDIVVTIQSKCGKLEKVCKEVKAKTGFKIEKWKNKKLFYRRGNKEVRTKYWDYYNSSVEVGHQCSELGEYKQCGILDSLNHILCLPKNEECPINDIQINDNSTAEKGYTTLPLNNGTYLHFSRDKINNTIYLELIVNQDTPCYNYKKETNNKILNYSLFIDPDDIKCETEFEGKGTNDEWKVIDSEPGEELLNNNDMLHYFKTDLIGFPQDSYTTPFHLYYRNYIGAKISKECIEQYENNGEIFNITKVKDLEKHYKQVKMNVLFAIIFLGAGFFSIIFRFTGSTRCNLTFHISTIILLLLGLFLIVITRIRNTLSFDIKIECADPVTKQFAEELIKNSRIYFIGSFVVCGLSSIMTIIEILGLFFLFKMGKEKGMGKSTLIQSSL